ncbi:alpha/beta hydrolase [Nocardiopsis metallicus]|uniref:Acetyl esterase/lipase n=1 Tax=Nocardiopsis metallicus TaxID=179819 RepID=A0A840WK56_9ACTN|nr:alpha/beta hydrolase [Nocardiopsis metallicus]MBB5491996.1 acetyl esterase/lipase [Nocardiopsis metallicus]
MSQLHPDLSRVRFLPALSFGPRTALLAQRLTARMRPGRTPADLSIEEHTAPGPEGSPPLSLRVYRPRSPTAPSPALLWTHGGGYLFGSPVQDERGSIEFARELGITVVALRYRKAPQHTAPTAAEDAYSALSWTVDNADRLGVDPGRVAIGGASAGGGITASLALMCHDRGGPRPVFQLLVYPMLDDRTAVRTDLDGLGVRMWSVASNRYAWRAYLGEAPGGGEVSSYAAAARREDLSGLPPAWIGVGTLDLFHDEDLAYADRLRAAGVPCRTTVVPGAFHGFDTVFPKTGAVREFRRAQTEALRSAFEESAPPPPDHTGTPR